MDRDTKIMLGAGVLQVAVAAGKSRPTSPDQAIEVLKSEMIPLIMNLGGLFILFKVFGR